jgi:flagellar basal body-associated protein FliL
MRQRKGDVEIMKNNKRKKLIAIICIILVALIIAGTCIASRWGDRNNNTAGNKVDIAADNSATSEDASTTAVETTEETEET